MSLRVASADDDNGCGCQATARLCLGLLAADTEDMMVLGELT